jgi:hypothetical protein
MNDTICHPFLSGYLKSRMIMLASDAKFLAIKSDSERKIYVEKIIATAIDESKKWN